MAVGRKTGGRKRGACNKATTARRLEIEKSGETPVQYMLRIMRDTGEDDARRDDMAKSVAPYLHAKLSAMQASLSGTLTLEQLITQSMAKEPE